MREGDCDACLVHSLGDEGDSESCLWLAHGRDVLSTPFLSATSLILSRCFPCGSVIVQSSIILVTPPLNLNALLTDSFQVA